MFLHCSKLCKFLSYLWLLFDEIDHLHMVFAFEFAYPSSTSLIFFLKIVALEPFFFSLGKHIKTNSPKEYYAKFWFPYPWFPTILAVYLLFFFFLPLPLCYQPKGYTCQVTFAQIMQMNGIILYEKCNQSQLNII